MLPARSTVSKSERTLHDFVSDNLTGRSASFGWLLVAGLVLSVAPSHAAPQSCAGWESDPQSFSRRAAENYARISLPTPDTINCSGSICDLHYSAGLVNPWDIRVDMSQVPGVVSVSGGETTPPGTPFRDLGLTRSYSYSCDDSGRITFTPA